MSKSTSTTRTIEAFVNLAMARRRRAISAEDKARIQVLEETVRDALDGARPAPKQLENPMPETRRDNMPLTHGTVRPTTAPDAPPVVRRMTTHDTAAAVGPAPSSIPETDEIALSASDQAKTGEVSLHERSASAYTPPRLPTFMQDYYSEALVPAQLSPTERPARVVSADGSNTELSVQARRLFGIGLARNTQTIDTAPAAHRTDDLARQPGPGRSRGRPAGDPRRATGDLPRGAGTGDLPRGMGTGDVPRPPTGDLPTTDVPRRTAGAPPTNMGTRDAPFHRGESQTRNVGRPATNDLRPGATADLTAGPPPTPTGRASAPRRSASVRGGRATAPTADLSPPAPKMEPSSVERPRRAPSRARPTAAPQVLVSLLDGTSARGFLPRFDPSIATFVVQDGSGRSRTYETDQILAIFFRVSAGAAPTPAEGTPVTVQLVNGREITGLTPDYAEGGMALTVVPDRRGGGTDRVWIPAAAVSAIEMDEVDE